MDPIHIYSDVICPWCFVGKIRLDKALASHKAESGQVPELIWHPYELNPDTPEEGENRLEYLHAKYGPERVEMIDERLNTIAEAEGFKFNWQGASRIPNTFKAHRLIAYGQSQGRAHEVADALFRAYFFNGRDIGELSILTAIGVECGLNRAALEEYFDGNQGVNQIRAEEEDARASGLRGVPYYLINGHPMYGAQELDYLMRALNAVPH